MRPLYEITAPLLARSFERDLRQRSAGRRRGVVSDTLTALMLVKHQESPKQLFVSTDGDAVGAVWIPKQPILLDPKDRGPFLVVTLTRTLAQQKRLSPRIIDRDRYTPSERKMLQDAIDAAARKRERLSGQSNNRPTWNGGRHVYA